MVPFAHIKKRRVFCEEPGLLLQAAEGGHGGERVPSPGKHVWQLTQQAGRLDLSLQALLPWKPHPDTVEH